MKVGDYIALKNKFDISYGHVVEGDFVMKPTLEIEQLKGQRVKVSGFNLLTCNPKRNSPQCFVLRLKKKNPLSVLIPGSVESNSTTLNSVGVVISFSGE